MILPDEYVLLMVDVCAFISATNLVDLSRVVMTANLTQNDLWFVHSHSSSRLMDAFAV